MSDDIKKAIVELLAANPKGLTLTSIIAGLDHNLPIKMICDAITHMTGEYIVAIPAYQLTQKGRTYLESIDNNQSGA